MVRQFLRKNGIGILFTEREAVATVFALLRVNCRKLNSGAHMSNA